MNNRLSSKRNEARRKEAEEKARRQRRLVIVAGVVVLLLAVLIAVATTLGGSDGGEDDRGAVEVADLAGSPGVRGELPPLNPDADADPAVGEQAPVAAGADFDGVPVSIGEPGRGQLVMFVASWCPACQEELPDVVSWLDAGGLPDDVDFTTVVTWLDDTRPNWPPDTWLEDENYTGPVLVDDADGSVAAAFGQPATPYWVVIDDEGRIATRLSGLISQEQMTQLANAVSSTG